MWQIWSQKDLEATANKMFPQHMSIPYSAFRRAKSYYFDKMIGMDYYTKERFFNSTYYSEAPLCWFIFGDYKYFSLEANEGTSNKLAYYGVVNMSLLTFKY